jgi:cell division septation protein DedD
LTKLPLNVNKADLGKKGVYYRVQAGSLKNKAAAQRICDELKQKKVGCFVVAP